MTLLTGLLLGAKLCSLQSGVVPLPTDLAPDAGAQIYVAPLQPVDDSRTVLWFTMRAGSTSAPAPQTAGMSGITDGGTLLALRFERERSTVDAAGVWYAATFCTGVRAERGDDFLVAPATTAAHAAMAVDRSLGTLTNSSGGTGWDPNDFFRVRPLTDTQLEIVDNDPSDPDNTANWQVFEHDGMSVERGIAQLLPGTFSAEHGGSTRHDPAVSFARTTWRMVGNGGGSGTTALTAQLLADGGVRIERLLEVNDTVEYVWEVVSFDDGTRVLTGREVLVPTQATATPALSPPVDVRRAVAFTSAGERWAAFGASPKDPGPALFTARIASPSQLELTRSALLGTSSTVVNWVVLEFPAMADAGTPAPDGGEAEEHHCVDSVPTPDGGCVVPKVDPHLVMCGCSGGSGLTVVALALLLLRAGRRGR